MHNDVKWVTVHSLIAWAFRQETHQVHLSKYQPFESGRFGGCEQQRGIVAARVMTVINTLPHDQRSMIWCAFTGRTTDQMAVASELPDRVMIRIKGHAAMCNVPLQLRQSIVHEWLGGDTVNTRKSAALIPPHSHMAVHRLNIKLRRELDKALQRAVCTAQGSLGELVSNLGVYGELF